MIGQCFSVRRVRLIAGNTMREAIRQRLFAFVGLLAVALVVSAQWLRELNFGSSELKFIADFGFGAMTFFGSVLTIIAMAQLFFSEIEHRTVLTLLAKPVRRSEFVIGKYSGVVALAGVFCATLTLLLMAVLWFRETTLMRDFPDAFGHGRAVSYLAVGVAGFAQWLKLAILGVGTLIVGSFARTQLFTTAAGFMILLICQLVFLAENAAVQGGSVVARLAAKSLLLLFPNFQLFDLSDSLGAGESVAWIQLARLTTYSAGYVIVACMLAALAFRRREI